MTDVCGCSCCPGCDWTNLETSVPEHNVEEWYTHLVLFSHTGKSIDILNCSRYWSHECHCTPCDVCQQGKHSAYHGPVLGQPVGSPPWGHEYVPEHGNEVTREILRKLGK